MTPFNILGVTKLLPLLNSQQTCNLQAALDRVQALAWRAFSVPSPRHFNAKQASWEVN